MTQLLREQMRVAAETVYDGIDQRYFFPGERQSNGPLTVLFAGSFRPYKRAHIVVQQAARMAAGLFSNCRKRRRGGTLPEADS